MATVTAEPATKKAKAAYSHTREVGRGLGSRTGAFIGGASQPGGRERHVRAGGGSMGVACGAAAPPGGTPTPAAAPRRAAAPRPPRPRAPPR
jgi:hypothetical protein